MKKWILLFLVCIIAAWATAQELRVLQTKAPQQAVFAAPFQVQYQLSHPKNSQVALAPDSLSKDFEIQHLQSQHPNPGETICQFTAFPFTLGRSTFTATFLLLGDDKTASTTSQPIYIDVTPAETFKDKKFREIRAAHLPFPWLTWLTALLALAACFYVLYCWKKRLQQDSLTIRQEEDSRPSHEIALSKLNALIQSGLWENKQYKLFYITFVDILREYLQRRFALDVSADTSSELLTRMKNKSDLQPYLPLVRELLTQSDLVKFARMIPQETQRNEHVHLLLQFVQDTTPKPAPQEPKK